MHTIMVGLAGQLHVYEAKCLPKWASRSPLTGWPLLRTIKAECRTTREVILVCSHASTLPIRLATTNQTHIVLRDLVGTIEPIFGVCQPGNRTLGFRIRATPTGTTMIVLYAVT